MSDRNKPDVHSIDGEFMRSHGIHWLTAGFIVIGESENKNRLVIN
jgi:hypothetical protein